MTDTAQKKKFFQQTIRNIREQFSSKIIDMKIVKDNQDCYMVAKYSKSGLKNKSFKQLIDRLTDGVEDVCSPNFVYSVMGFHNKKTKSVKISFWEEKNLTHKNIVVSYPGQYYFSTQRLDDVISKQMKQFKAVSTGSGLGFGYRDVSFLVPNKQVKLVKQNIKDLVVKKSKISAKELKVKVYEAC